MKKLVLVIIGSWLALAPSGLSAGPVETIIEGNATYPLPTVDVSGDTSRQVVVAQGTASVYQGHPTTVLMPDGHTLYCVWTIGHGGTLGPLKRSDDGGKSWSDLLPVPESWKKTSNCPTIYRLKDPEQVERLVVFAGHGLDEKSSVQVAWSEDKGKTWTDMKDLGLPGSAMPFCSVAPIDGGKRLIGITNIRRPGETKEDRSNVIAQSLSEDGGRSWTTPWRIVLDLPGLKPCEPELVRSPDGKELLCLLRENVKRVALFMTSVDEGRTWSKPRPLPTSLYGDRHKAQYLPDGRLVICFRDTGKGSPTRDHFVAWVGKYEDILAGRNGDFRVKLLHSFKGADCGYPGVEVLPDATIVATTYIKYREGPEKNSVVSTRFTTREIEQRIRAAHTAAEKTQ